MLQEIQDKIAETADLKSALRLVLKADARYCILKFLDQTDSEQGQIWLRYGNEIIAASSANGETGHHALLKLLTLPDAKYRLAEATTGQQGENINFKVLDILDDEQLVVQSLMSVLGIGTDASRSGSAAAEDSWSFETQEKIGTDFHTTTKLMEEIADDDLAASRKVQIEQLENVSTDAPENFYVSGMVKHENDIGVQRQQEYEYLKEFDAEEKEAFYQTPVVIEKDPPDGLNELQQSVLKIMEQQYSDKEAFLHTDSALADISSLPPKWVDEPQQDPSAVAPPFQGSQPGVFSSVPHGSPSASQSIGSIPNSQFTENPASLTEQQLNAESQRMRAVDPNMALVEQGGRTFDPKANQVAKTQERAKRGFPISKPVFIGVAIVALALPVVALNIAKHNEEEAMLDLDEKETTSAHVNNYVDKESRAAKPQEPFRMPAGSQTGSGAGPGYAADAERSHASAVDPDALENFKWKQPSQPAPPMSAQDLTDAGKIITTGEQLIASGQATAAVQQLEAALYRYPRFSRLRVAAIEANRKLGRYERVRQLCIDGMHQAPVESDFYLFLNMLKDVPKAGQGQPTTISPQNLVPKPQAPVRSSQPAAQSPVQAPAQTQPRSSSSPSL